MTYYTRLVAVDWSGEARRCQTGGVGAALGPDPLGRTLRNVCQNLAASEDRERGYRCKYRVEALLPPVVKSTEARTAFGCLERALLLVRWEIIQLAEYLECPALLEYGGFGDLSRLDGQFRTLRELLGTGDFEALAAAAEPLAEAGIPYAQGILGICLGLQGPGDPVARESACMKWLELAARGGDPSACAALVTEYARGGRTFPADARKADSYRRRAQAFGGPFAPAPPVS